MIEKLVTESVGLTFGNFCNEDLMAREWWRIEALISFSQFCHCSYFNLNWFRFNFLPDTKKSNNIICWNYPAPLVLLSKHKKKHNQDKYPKKYLWAFLYRKGRAFLEGALFYSSKPDLSSQ